MGEVRRGEGEVEGMRGRLSERGEVEGNREGEREGMIEEVGGWEVERRRGDGGEDRRRGGFRRGEGEVERRKGREVEGTRGGGVGRRGERDEMRERGEVEGR